MSLFEDEDYAQISGVHNFLYPSETFSSNVSADIVDAILTDKDIAGGIVETNLARTSGSGNIQFDRYFKAGKESGYGLPTTKWGKGSIFSNDILPDDTRAGPVAFPVLPLRFKNKWADAEKINPVLGKIGLSFETLQDAILSNPDGVDDIDHVYFGFTPKVMGTNVGGTSEYHYEFAKYLYANLSGEDPWVTNSRSEDVEPNTHSVLLTEENGFRTIFEYHGSTKRTFFPDAALRRKIDAAGGHYSYFDLDIAFRVITYFGDSAETNSDPDTYFPYVPFRCLSINSFGLVTEYTLISPAMTFFVDGSNSDASQGDVGKMYSWRGLIKGEKYLGKNPFNEVNPRNENGRERRLDDVLRYSASNLKEDSEVTDPCMMPLLKVPLEAMTAKGRNELYWSSISMDIQAVEITTVDWYLNEDFLKIIEIIVIVYSIATAQPQVYFSLQGAVALAKKLLIRLLKYYLYQEAILLVAEEFGEDVALALAAVAFAYGMTEEIQIGDPGFCAKPLPGAEALLAAVPAITAGLQKFASIELDELAGDQFDAEQLAEEREEKISAAEKLLSGNIVDNEFLSVNTLLNRASNVSNYNSVQDYYEIASHTQNPGVLALDGIKNYYELALTLPKPPFA